MSALQSDLVQSLINTSASAHLMILPALQKLYMQSLATLPCLLLVRHQQNTESMGRINGQNRWAESRGRMDRKADRQGSEHGILRWVCSLMVPQLIGAPKLMLLLWRPELHMGLGVVVGHP